MLESTIWDAYMMILNAVSLYCIKVIYLWCSILILYEVIVKKT